ncbi:hypothetical protein SAMN05216215_10736 [Saccharopolyspora shandongensis]|uniref:Lipoprotein LprG n=1 Tax=Saccharopolyspora shandongensis TaxID=418495 RepID=A0A1H3SZU3_9PSEU|nr:hypothetical protein [Saccharopolyspora shandongensis]SDZ43300.1 hypothetical protein SAMN05216215_10736 [Saccharopolyspora shandongensis]
MPRASTRTAVLSAGLALIAALGACGAEPPPRPGPLMAARPDPRPRADAMLSQVMNKISERGSVHSSVRGSLGVVGELTAEGAVRYRGPRTDLAFEGQTRTPGNRSPQHLSLSIMDGVGYLRTPLVRPAPDKPWLKITPGGADFGDKLLGPALDQLHDAVDPRAAFTGVEPATRIQTSAPDMVDGKPTTRYELRIITSQAADVADDPQQRDRFRQAADAGEPELGYQLWLDDSGLPARFAADQEVAQAGEVSLTSTYRDWGVPAEIPVPPAGQIGVFDALPPQAQQPPR